MDLEQKLRETYTERLDGLGTTGGDVAGARRAGAWMQTKRRVTAVVAAVAIGGSLLGLSGRDSTAPPAAPFGHWRQLPAAPLSPRVESLTVWTGNELLVLGGAVTACPSHADSCTEPESVARDAAAYNPSTGRWLRIAPAPRPVLDGQSAVVAAGHVIVATNQGYWYVYAPASGRWSTVHTPWPRSQEMNPWVLSASGDTVYTSAHGRVHTYDVATGRFSTLPADRLRPSLIRTMIVATPSGPVITGMRIDQVPQPDHGQVPTIVYADVWDGHAWRRLPATGQITNDHWAWTGTRLVDPEPSTQHALPPYDWGRSYPNGGMLNPVTGAWNPLPAELTEMSADSCPDGGVQANAGPWFAVCGLAYDDATGRFYRLGPTSGMPGYAASAAWAGRRLFVFGGAAHAPSGTSGATGFSNGLWVWTP